jgi:hypothetical protein
LEIECVAVHEEVPEEDAAVKTFGALKKQHGDWHLAVRCCRNPNKQTQGNGGTRKKLAAACRGMTHQAISAWHKEHCCQGQGKDKAVPRTQKGQTFRKRRRAKPEGINGIRD